MSNILDTIVERKLVEVADRKRQVDKISITSRAADQSAPRLFKQSLLNKIALSESAVIAEVKKASPSKGVIREDFDPSMIAGQYEQAGATCLSVLTDEDFFQGNDKYLQQAKSSCALPVLRKDFIIDEYQIFESRALGADCVLLIVSILDDAQLKSFHAIAKGLGLSVLVEVHDEEELHRALAIDPDILGVNNRNLKTFEVSLDTTVRLKADVPPGVPIITESGIHRVEDVAKMHEEGIFGFLVGEAFMRQPDPGRALKAIFA